MANQFLRPTSDVSAGDWTTAPLYAKIDEVTADTADFIQSVNFNNKDAAATSTCEVGLGSGSDPNSSSGHVIRYKARETTTSGMMDLTVTLKQGATTIASWAENALSNSWTDFSHTLSSAEADAITNYAALSVQFVADNNDKQTVNRYVQVAWLEFETPAVGIPLQSTVTVTASQTSALSLGASESLASTVSSISSVTATIGSLIYLGGTVSAESTCSIDMSFFGESKPLSSNVSIVTAISGALSFGANEGLEGALLATALAIGALSFGASESLQSTISITANGSGSLSFVQYMECVVYVELTTTSNAILIKGLNAEALTEITSDSALSVSYGLFANPTIVTTIGIPSTVYESAVVTPLSKITWTNAVMQSSMYNSEIERIYKLMSSLKSGEVIYANHFRIGYDETHDALVFYYNDTPIMRLDSSGNLEIAGTLYENVL